MKYKGYIEGPRWAGIADGLKKAAYGLGLDISTETEKGFLRETVYYTIEGEENKVNRLIRAIKSIVDDQD